MEPRRYGPFPYTPINRRPKLKWPNDARVAVWVCPNIEVFALNEPVPLGSGKVPERSLEKVFTQLGSVVEAIDIVIDAGELQASLPSTVVDTTSSTPVILREGTISASDIWNVVRAEL